MPLFPLDGVPALASACLGLSNATPFFYSDKIHKTWNFPFSPLSVHSSVALNTFTLLCRSEEPFMNLHRDYANLCTVSMLDSVLLKRARPPLTIMSDVSCRPQFKSHLLREAFQEQTDPVTHPLGRTAPSISDVTICLVSVCLIRL